MHIYNQFLIKKMKIIVLSTSIIIFDRDQKMFVGFEYGQGEKHEFDPKNQTNLDQLAIVIRNAQGKKDSLSVTRIYFVLNGELIWDWVGDGLIGDIWPFWSSDDFMRMIENIISNPKISIC